MLTVHKKAQDTFAKTALKTMGLNIKRGFVI